MSDFYCLNQSKPLSVLANIDNKDTKTMRFVYFFVVSPKILSMTSIYTDNMDKVDKIVLRSYKSLSRSCNCFPEFS